MSSIGFEPFLSSSYKSWYVDRSPSVAQRGRSRTTYSSYGTTRSSDHLHYSSTSVLLGRPDRFVDIDISHANQVSSEFRAVRTQEKAQMQDLNDRFAGYIERVHELEQANRGLQAELLLLQQRHAHPFHLRGLYEQELRSLRAKVEEARVERQAALSHRESMEDALRSLQASYEEGLVAREDTEGRLLEARKEASERALARIQLEKKVDTLFNELEFLKKLHEGEISELQAQVQYGAQIAIETEAIKPDLSSALREIRVQYEKMAAKNIQSAEDWFREKMGHLTDSAAQHSDAVRNSKDEAGEFRRQVQACVLEIDACKGVNQALEKQLRDVEERQSAEVASMQDTISDLEDELRSTKGEMARYLKEYQDLLNVKMALDIEIAAYRKLLEGEESRFNVGMTSLVGTYSAGPVYSRPLFSMSTLSSSAHYLLGSRMFSADEDIASQEAAVDSTQMDEEKEEEVNEEEVEETEGEEKNTKEEVKDDDQEEEEEPATEEEEKETVEDTKKTESVKVEDEEGGDKKDTDEEQTVEKKEEEEKGDEEKVTEVEEAEKETESSEEKADTSVDQAMADTVPEDRKTEKVEKEKVELNTEKTKEEVELETVKEKSKEETEDKGKEESDQSKAKKKADAEKPKGKEEGEKDKSETKEKVKQEKGKEEAEKPKGKK
ncbi:hypothetical protein DNTS_003152 [Danionella cerebrum]|uniref:IF rod domain-containing protein n=1 Tax=Danionella cerebrum TaxID=2873325 RepID=A0A553N5V7_9TELE|nr:hypothetical protein DNTS_003152 [Danionella translucida]